MLNTETTLLFGIGAQKAGTTWVHAWLSAHPEVLVPPLKEVHYFDVMTLKSERVHFDRHVAKAVTHAEALRGLEGPALGRGIERLRTKLDLLSIYATKPGNHRPYLKWLTRDLAGQKVVADFTPAYALLSRETFAEMAALAPRTRFLFILRDPVDRLWSAVRMGVEAEARSEEEFRERCLARLDELLASRKLDRAHRSNYIRTLGELEAAVPDRNVLCLFYEDLFAPAAIARIAAFLGIEALPADYETRANSGRPLGLPDDREAAAARRLASQYLFAADRFGAALPAKWRARMANFGIAPAGAGSS
jgi:hypothetical protein